MNSKFNIDLEQVSKDLEEVGKKDRELIEELWIAEILEVCDEILSQNKKDCEQFKGRDGI